MELKGSEVNLKERNMKNQWMDRITEHTINLQTNEGVLR